MLVGQLLHRLTHTATVERATGSTDPWGNDASEYAAVLTDVPCWWWVTTGDERINDARTVTVGVEFVLFDPSADVRANDRITQVVDEYGQVIFDTFREVEHVARARTHQTATLRSTT